jgi:hypothetical protein
MAKQMRNQLQPANGPNINKTCRNTILYQEIIVFQVPTLSRDFLITNESSRNGQQNLDQNEVATAIKNRKSAEICR